MVKKQENKKNYCWVGVTLIIITILIVGGIIYYKMPKQVCHLESNIEVINLKGAIIYGMEYEDYQNRWSDKNTEYLCSDEIEVDNLQSMNSIWFVGMEGVCILKNYKKICEVVYK